MAFILTPGFSPGKMHLTGGALALNDLIIGYISNTHYDVVSLLLRPESKKESYVFIVTIALIDPGVINRGIQLLPCKLQ